MIDPALTTVLATFTEVTARNTASAIQTRVKTARAQKQNEETITELVDIINQLSSDRSELVGIANALQEQLVSQTITAEEIKYITDKVIPTVETLMGLSGARDNEVVAALKTLVSVETLTVLQLIGFNFKSAVGEPLTDVVKSLVLSLAPQAKRGSAPKRR
ncbi:MAG: hypothetical protein WAW88_02130 [Nocardioides sp.]